jgi:hypothetical protein
MGLKEKYVLGILKPHGLWADFQPAATTTSWNTFYLGITAAYT